MTDLLGRLEYCSRTQYSDSYYSLNHPRIPGSVHVGEERDGIRLLEAMRLLDVAEQVERSRKPGDKIELKYDGLKFIPRITSQ